MSVVQPKKSTVCTVKQPVLNRNDNREKLWIDVLKYPFYFVYLSLLKFSQQESHYHCNT